MITGIGYSLRELAYDADLVSTPIAANRITASRKSSAAMGFGRNI